VKSWLGLRGKRLVRGLGLVALLAATEAMARPPLPATPAPVDAVLHVRPFVLDEGFAFDWRKERPTVTRGTLVVLQVAPELVYPRQTAEPVLYVGEQTAMRLNVGYPSGRVVAIVPGDPPGEGALVFFGTPELPERVTAATIAAEVTKARAAGIAPAARDARVRADGAVTRANLAALLVDAAALIDRYAPDESARAMSLRTQQ